MEIKKIQNQIIRGKLEPLNLKKVDAIAFHHMASSSMSVKDIENYHVNTNGWIAIGYNYWIDSDGTIYEGRGLNKGAGVANHNSHIISIGLRGDFENYFPTKEQYYSSKTLVKHLKEKIPTITKTGCHKDWNATVCPGKNFDINIILKEEINMEFTDVKDIVENLALFNVITNKELWLTKLSDDKNAYWLARKALNALRGIKQ